MEALSGSKVEEFCAAHPDWEHAEAKLVRLARFADFRQAMAFVNKVADLAEAAGHHPDIDIRYSTVTLGLVTHDAGGITERDLEMAEALSSLF